MIGSKNKKAPQRGTILFVAEPGVEPGLSDYEPDVQPYTTPHIVNLTEGSISLL